MEQKAGSMENLIFIAVMIIVALIAFIFMFQKSDDNGWFIGWFISIVGLCGVGFTALSFSFTTWSYKASSYKAVVINREFGTKYTAQEIYYASDVIETIKQMNRQRLEVNGDILKSK